MKPWEKRGRREETSEIEPPKIPPLLPSRRQRVQITEVTHGFVPPYRPSWVVIVWTLALSTWIAAAGLLGVWYALTRPVPDVLTVQRVYWSHTHVLVERRLAGHDDWLADVPPEALAKKCASKKRSTQIFRAPTVQCIAPTDPDPVCLRSVPVMDMWCSYTLEEWRETDRQILSGRTVSTAWPALVAHGPAEHLERETVYRVVLRAPDGSTCSYTPTDSQDLARFTPQSKWRAVEPAIDLCQEIVRVP